MPFTTLGQLIDEIGDYDEYRPIWIEDRSPLTRETPCFILLGDAAEYGDWAAVPVPAQDRGMVRFLSSGQMMDVEGTLDALQPGFDEAILLQALEEFFRTS